MAGTTLSTLDSILKTQYLPAVNEQFNNLSVILSRLEKDYDSVVGKNFTMALHTGRNESVAGRGEGGTLPVAGNQSYKNAIVPMKYLYGRLQITGQTIKAAQTNEGAFLKAVDSEMKGLMNDFRASVNRQLWGDGTGALTVCGTTSNSTTVVVASTRKLRVGMRIDVLVTADGTTSTGATDRVVSSITDATHFVISGAAITTDNTFSVYVMGSRNYEIMGVEGIFSATSTLQGLDVATYPFWKANVLSNSGSARAISEVLMQTALDTTEQNSAGKTSAIYTSYGVRRAYQSLLAALKQYTNPLELKGGFTALDYNGLPLIADKDATPGKLFFADESQLKFYRMSDIEWMQEDGAVLSRVSGQDAYEGILYLYHELGTSMRNAMTVLSDITEA
jgi:hypothetical protein